MTATRVPTSTPSSWNAESAWPITRRAGLAQRLAETELRLAKLAPEPPSVPPSPSWRLRDVEREDRERQRRVLDRLLETASPSEFERIVGPVAASVRHTPPPVDLQVPRSAPATVPPTLRAAARSAPPTGVERAVREELAVKPGRPTSYRSALISCRARIVTDAIERARGNKSVAARELGLSRQWLYDVLRQADGRP